MTLTREQLNQLDDAIHLCAWCKRRAEALVSDPPAATASAEEVEPPPAPLAPRARERAIASRRETRKDGRYEQSGTD